jgi:hypothetical protein
LDRNPGNDTDFSLTEKDPEPWAFRRSSIVYQSDYSYATHVSLLGTP